MTTKKKAQWGTKGKLAELKARAGAIVKDVRGHDADARRAVWLALANLKFAETNPTPATKHTDVGYCERELSAVLRKVEKGEAAFDVDRYHAERVAQACAVYAIIEGSDVPDFISDAVAVALDEAARELGREVWLDVDGSGDGATGGYSVELMTNLFERVGVGGPKLEPKRDLAGHVAAVLSHPDTPSKIYNALAEAVSDFSARDEVTNSAEVIRVALKVNAEKEGGAK